MRAGPCPAQLVKPRSPNRGIAHSPREPSQELQTGEQAEELGSTVLLADGVGLEIREAVLMDWRHREVPPMVQDANWGNQLKMLSAPGRAGAVNLMVHAERAT